MQKPSRADTAYFAGILDGEGCIAISTAWFKNADGMRKRRYRLFVRITMTDLPVLKWIEARFGGKTYSRSATWQNRNPHCRQQWQWTTADSHAEKVVRRLLPFLIGKRPEALAAIEFRKHVHRPGEHYRENDERWKKQVAIHQLLMDLKVRNFPVPAID